MVVFQRPLQGDGRAADGRDPLNLVPFDIVGSDKQLRAHVILRRVLDREALAARLCGRGEHRVHRGGQTLVILLLQHRERPDRLLIGHARDHAIGRLIVELEEVRVNVDLGGLEIRKVVVHPFTGQRIVHTIVHICAEHERIFQVIVLSNRLFLFM